MDFKAGDRVRITEHFNHHLHKGHTGVVGSRGKFMSYGGVVIDVVWDPPCDQNNGGYFPETLEKIGERRVGWRVDYRPVPMFLLGCIGAIYNSEKAAKDNIKNYARLGPPVRIEYDLPLLPASEKVKVGDRVSVGARDGEVIAIEPDHVWFKDRNDCWTATLVNKDIVKPLDLGTGMNSYVDACQRAVDDAMCMC